jgi:lysozyme family protein
MSDFYMAIPTILKHEGGWVCHPSDPGGETNHGISTLMVERERISNQELGLPEGRSPGWMKAMTVESASKIYKKFFWDKPGYSQILDQRMATKVFDVAVNCGPARAHVMAQRAVNRCGQNVQADGILGSKSIQALNTVDPQAWMLAMCDEQLKYYQAIVAKRPSLAVFLKNWTKRASWSG